MFRPLLMAIRARTLTGGFDFQHGDFYQNSILIIALKRTVFELRAWKKQSKQNRLTDCSGYRAKQELSSSWDGRPWPQQTWTKKRRGLQCPFRGGSWVPL